jgi:hypothetical protein
MVFSLIRSELAGELYFSQVPDRPCAGLPRI